MPDVHERRGGTYRLNEGAILRAAVDQRAAAVQIRVALLPLDNLARAKRVGSWSLLGGHDCARARNATSTSVSELGDFLLCPFHRLEIF